MAVEQGLRRTGAPRRAVEVGPCVEHRRSWHLLVSDQPTLFEDDELGLIGEEDRVWADPARGRPATGTAPSEPRRRRTRQLRPAASGR